MEVCKKSYKVVKKFVKKLIPGGLVMKIILNSSVIPDLFFVIREFLINGLIKHDFLHIDWIGVGQAVGKVLNIIFN
jgi:hypothetical protein